MSNVNECTGELALPTNTNAELALSKDNTTSNSEIKYNDNINMENLKTEIPTNSLKDEIPRKVIRENIIFEAWIALKYYKNSNGETKKNIVSGELHKNSTKWSLEKFKKKLDKHKIDYDEIKAEVNFKNSKIAFLDFDKWGITISEIINDYPFLSEVENSKGNTRGFRFIVENNDFIGGSNYTKVNKDKNIDILCEKIWLNPSDIDPLFTDMCFYHKLSIDKLKQFLTNENQKYKFANERNIKTPLPINNNFDISEFSDEEKKSKNFKMADALPLHLVDTGSYQDWITIVYALASVNEYKIARYISMKSIDAYDETKFNKLFKSYDPSVKGKNGGPITILTLYNLVKQHAPDKFKQINKEFNKKSKKDDDIDDDDTNIEDDYDNITNGKCADIFWDYFSNKYSFSGINWYRFNDSGIYEDINKIHTHILRRDIIVAMSKWEQNQIQSITTKYEDGEINLKEMKALKKKIFKKVRSIESDTFLKQCIGSLCDKFLDEGLEEKLDKNYTKLFAFKNGVYDFENKIFRKATKEDYVSNFVPYNYDETDIDHDYFDNLINMIFSDSYSENDVYVENEKAKFFKIHLGSLIEGGNREEKVYFWVGKGRNGKGVQDHLLQKTLGDTNSGYYGSIDPTYFTTKNDDVNKATPVKMNFYKRRLVVAQEPNGSQEKEDKFQEGNFKSQSGNDKMSGRHLRGNTVYWYPTHKTIIPTNHLPYFTGKSDGLFERIVIIKFDNKFEVNFNKNDPRQRPANIKLKESLINKEAKFFNYLLQWFWIYKKEGLKNIPKEFEIERKKYIQSLHTVRSYINENLETTDNKDDYVSTTQAYNDFIKYVDSTISQTVFCNEIKNEGIIINRIRKSEYGKTQQIRVLLGYKFKITENVTINIEPDPAKNDKCLIKDDEEDTLSMNSTKNEDDDDELSNVLVNKLG